jgi:hypothetical protein
MPSPLLHPHHRRTLTMPVPSPSLHPCPRCTLAVPVPMPSPSPLPHPHHHCHRHHSSRTITTTVSLAIDVPSLLRFLRHHHRSCRTIALTVPSPSPMWFLRHHRRSMSRIVVVVVVGIVMVEGRDVHAVRGSVKPASQGLPRQQTWHLHSRLGARPVDECNGAAVDIIVHGAVQLQHIHDDLVALVSACVDDQCIQHVRAEVGDEEDNWSSCHRVIESLHHCHCRCHGCIIFAVISAIIVKQRATLSSFKKIRSTRVLYSPALVEWSTLRA